MKQVLKMMCMRGIIIPAVFLNLTVLLFLSKLLSSTLNTKEPLATFDDLVDIIKELWVASAF